MMSIANLYAIVSTNLAGIIILVMVMAYLSWHGVIVGGRTYEAMEKDRDYWRERTMKLLDEMEPRLDRMANEPPVVTGPPTATVPPDEVTP